MGEWREIPELLKLSQLEIVTWLVTFLLTVFADLTVAVEAGMILAALVFIRKVTLPPPSRTSPRNICAKDTRIFCSTRKFLRTSRSSASTGRFFLAPPIRSKKLPSASGIAAGRDSAASQHDRDRCHWIASSRKTCRHHPRLRPRADSLRRARAARALDASGRIRAARGRREHLPARRRRRLTAQSSYTRTCNKVFRLPATCQNRNQFPTTEVPLAPLPGHARNWQGGTALATRGLCILLLF